MLNRQIITILFNQTFSILMISIFGYSKGLLWKAFKDFRNWYSIGIVMPLLSTKEQC